MREFGPRLRLHEGLTTETILAGLRKRAEEAVPPAPQEREYLEPFFAAAAVLHLFDPASLTAAENSRLLDAQILNEYSSSAIGYSGNLFRALDTDVRVKELGRLGNKEAMRQALGFNPEREQTVVQRLFENWLDDALRLKDLNYSELEALRLLSDWDLDRFGDFPTRESIETARARRASVALFEHLVDQNFVGRKAELKALRDYVGVARSSLWKKLRAFATDGRQPPLVLVGPGGVGKTALIGRFLLEHVKAPETGWFPFVYLAFDAETVDVREPWTILNQASEQLSTQVLPDLASETGSSSDNQQRQQQVDLALAAFRMAVGQYQDRRTQILSRTSQVTSQSARFDLSAEAHDELYVRFGQLLKALSLRSGTHQGASRVPVVMVLDTFEEVVYRTNEDLEGLWRMLAAVQGVFPNLRAVIAGRIAPREFTVGGLRPRSLVLGDLAETDAHRLLKSLGVQSKAARASIVRQVGRSPLTLKLAALAAQDLKVDSKGFRELKNRNLMIDLAPDLIRGQLYRRILDHIHDPQVRALAHPGMTLRRVTPDLIQNVLAPLCMSDENSLAEVDEKRADELFDALRQEHSLVKLDDDLSLRFREEVRTPMLKLLAADKHKLVEAIHQSAASYYMERWEGGPTEWAELLYHLMMLGRPSFELEQHWRVGVERYLSSALDEIPDDAKIWLASHMSIELPAETYQRAKLVEWERLIGGKAQEALRYSGPEPVLELLQGRSDRSEESPLYTLEIRARMSLGEHDKSEFQKALEISRNAIAGWPMHNLGRLAEIMWFGAQSARGIDDIVTAREMLRDLSQLSPRLDSLLPGVQALTELILLTDGTDQKRAREQLAALFARITPDEIDSERALIRLACVRLGEEFGQVILKHLPSVSVDLFWQFDSNPAPMVAVLPEVVADLAETKQWEWMPLRDRLSQQPQSFAEIRRLLEEALALAVRFPSKGALRVVLDILGAEKGDLRASGLAGVDQYRESFELRASAESAS